MSEVVVRVEKVAAGVSGSLRKVMFEVGAGVTALEIVLRIKPPHNRARVDVIVQDPNGFRGHTMTSSGYQLGLGQMRIATDGASPGAIGGAILPGTWTLLLEPVNFSQEASIHIEVTASFEPRATINLQSLFEPRVIKPQAGWYRGELHAHSRHSTGSNTVAELVEAAKGSGLDFLALTDHNTISGWGELEALQSGIALIRSCELTTARGHANAHGLRRWVDPHLEGERNLEELLHEVRSQGALFGVNHPFSNNVGWQHQDTDWSQIDLIEVYHHLEYAHNTLQLAWWDQLLNRGFAVVGIAGTDTKNAFQGHHKLGQALTYVYADELSEEGILQGLRRGQVIVSLGPRLEFWATSAGQTVPMFGSAPAGEPIQFYVSLSEFEGPVVIYVIKNGLFFEAEVFHQAVKGFSFCDMPEGPAYYRLEIHSLPRIAANGYDRRQRSWETFLACSNPIFAGGEYREGKWK